MPSLHIGDTIDFTTNWTAAGFTKSGTLTGRVVSFDAKTICVAVEQEGIGGAVCQELFWVSRTERSEKR